MYTYYIYNRQRKFIGIKSIFPGSADYFYYQKAKKFNKKNMVPIKNFHPSTNLLHKQMYKPAQVENNIEKD